MSGTWPILQRAAHQLSEAGYPSALTDARLLLAHLLDVNPGQLALTETVPAEIRDRFAEALARRLAGEPVQHITGTAHFRYEELSVGPGVFIPRPETEVLVDNALALLSERRPGSRRVVELCAGSGAISLSLAREIGGLVQWAVELSGQAWPYLVANLRETSVTTVHADMADALQELNGTVDLVVVNPPYIPSGMRSQLPRDVARMDPDLALFGGPDGLDAIRVVAGVAHRLLVPGGWVLCEHDESHPRDAAALFAEPGFSSVETRRDLAGRPRLLIAQRSAWQD